MLEREFAIKALAWKYTISDMAARRMVDELAERDRMELERIVESYKAATRK